jgi:hypothetical protein
MKKFFQAAVLGVIAMATLALALPTPVSVACVRCLYTQCPPCTLRAGQTCFKCGTCQPIPGCEPR